jgi:PAS domain S-box-containing protein
MMPSNQGAPSNLGNRATTGNGTSAPFGFSRNPFEPGNGPETSQALQPLHQGAHRIGAFAVGLHLLVALGCFVAADQSLAWLAIAVFLGGSFWAVAALTPPSAPARRHAAAIVLSGFPLLYSFGGLSPAFATGCFVAGLLLLMLFHDPAAMAPAAFLAGGAELVHAAFPASGNVSLATFVPGILWVSAAAIATGLARIQRGNLFEILRHQARIASENVRLTAELEKARQAGGRNSRDPFAGARPGFSGTFARVESASTAVVSEERYRMVIETAFDAIVIVDADSERIIDLNPRALELLGRAPAEVLGQDHALLYPAEKQAASRTLFRRAAKGELRTIEIELADRDGRPVPCEVAFSVSHLPKQKLVQGVFRDLTERKKTEAEKGAILERLQEAQRLESLNILAGGLAHDFNNILMSVLGFATMGKEQSAENKAVAGCFTKIEAATLRAGELCRQMLAFAGRAQVSMRHGDLNEAIRSFEEPLRTKVPPHLRLEIQLTAGLPAVNFDTAQLGQVVVSMITNAIEAIEALPGTITLKTLGSPVDDPARRDGFSTPQIPQEFCTVLEIADTGCGMSAEQVRRIFEPFYSTKVIGRGLGLSETLGMIRSHHGAVQVTSRRNAGSTFRLYFPAIPVLPAAETARPAPPWQKRQASEPLTALVVDDEPTIRDIVGAMLTAAGFTVKYAADGTEALAIVSQPEPGINVVLLDLVMPGVPSPQVLEKIRTLGPPKVRVIMMSGYSEAEVLKRCGDNRPDGFLPKPFSSAHLKAALNL